MWSALPRGTKNTWRRGYVHQLANLEVLVSLSWLPKSINYLRYAARYGLTRPTERENSVFGLKGGLRSVTNYMGKTKKEKYFKGKRKKCISHCVPCFMLRCTSSYSGVTSTTYAVKIIILYASV
jgi:hypothetical protein